MINDPLLKHRPEAPQPQPEAQAKPDAKKYRPRTLLLGAGAAALLLVGGKNVGESFVKHRTLDKAELAAGSRGIEAALGAPVKVDTQKKEHDANAQGAVGYGEIAVGLAVGLGAIVDHKRRQQAAEVPQQPQDIPGPGPQ